jgi:cysteine desulfurase / selenocysteine lyase
VREVYGKPLVYLDNGASAQKPQAVIDAVSHAYERNTPTSTAACTTSPTRHRAYEAARETVRRFLNAERRPDRLHQVRLDRSDQPRRLWLGRPTARRGDEIVLSIMEHHSNIVPWHFLRERQGAAGLGAGGRRRRLSSRGVREATLTDRTKLVAITHMSNVLGTVVDDEGDRADRA